MAQGDVSLFRPSEDQYRDPGTGRDVMAARGREKAGYLSSMDQFYAKLESEEAMFAQTMDWERERLASTQEWEKEKYTTELEAHEEEWTAQLGVLEDWYGAQTELGYAQLEVQEDWYGTQAELSREQMAMQQEESEWMQDYMGASLQFESQLAAATFEAEYGSQQSYIPAHAVQAMAYSRPGAEAYAEHYGLNTPGAGGLSGITYDPGSDSFGSSGDDSSQYGSTFQSQAPSRSL